MKTLFKEKWISSCQESDKSLSLLRFHGGREIQTHGQRPMVLPSTSFVKALRESDVSDSWHEELHFSLIIQKAFSWWTWDSNSRPTAHGLSTTPFVKKALVRWATGERLTDRLPKLSLITIATSLLSPTISIDRYPPSSIVAVNIYRYIRHSSVVSMETFHSLLPPTKPINRFVPRPLSPTISLERRPSTVYCRWQDLSIDASHTVYCRRQNPSIDFSLVDCRWQYSLDR